MITVIIIIGIIIELLMGLKEDFYNIPIEYTIKERWKTLIIFDFNIQSIIIRILWFPTWLIIQLLLISIYYLSKLMQLIL